MNRRSFLWRGLCSSVPLFASSSFSQQIATLPISKSSDAELTAFTQTLTGPVYRPGNPNYERLRKGYAAKFDQHPALVIHPVNAKDMQSTLRFATAISIANWSDQYPCPSMVTCRPGPLRLLQ